MNIKSLSKTSKYGLTAGAGVLIVVFLLKVFLSALSSEGTPDASEINWPSTIFLVLILLSPLLIKRYRLNRKNKRESPSEEEDENPSTAEDDHGVENWAIQTAWVMYLSGWVIAFLVVVAFAYYANSYIRYGDFYDWSTQRTFSRLEFSGWDNPRTMTGPSYWVQVMDSNAEAYEIDFFGRRGCIKPLTYPLNTSFRAEGSDVWGPMLDYQDHTPAESNAAGGIRLQAPDASPRSRKAVAIIEFPRALTLGDEDFCRSEELMKVWRLL